MAEPGSRATRLRYAFAAAFCLTIAAFVAMAVASTVHADAVADVLFIAGIAGAVVVVALFVAARLAESRLRDR